MQTILVVDVVLVSVTLIVLAVGVVCYIRRLNAAVKEVSESLTAFREQVLPLAGQVRQTLDHTDELVRTTRDEVERIGRLTRTVEDIVEGRTIAKAAEKAVESSKSTLVLVLEGIKEGIRAFRHPADRSKEAKADEQ